ncbi:DUF2971 domain-containing protein [Alcaligenaceae bacterium]|nr:DUF2971 domain-containing protein [Alcaligenaceae bacterium]
MTEQEKQLIQIFLPHAMRELQRVGQSRARFAHYTSAETGLKIFQSEKMLLRNSNLMNDFSEVRHGIDCLLSAYNGPLGNRLKVALRTVRDDLPQTVETSFNSEIMDFRTETYLMSVSEHDDHEDKFGRLSMWRAYAPKNGVAFILNNRPFICESNALNAFTSPVAYSTREDFQPAFQEVVSSIENNIETLQHLGAKQVHDRLLNAFRFAVQSTKHPAFKEEREWRVIYSPTLLLRDGRLTEEQGKRVPTEIMTLGGVPQRVYAIPCRDYPEEGFVGATIPDLLDRVLIGPSQDSHTIAQAYVEELTRLNVPDAHNKVVITGIPLRH